MSGSDFLNSIVLLLSEGRNASTVDNRRNQLVMRLRHGNSFERD